MGRSCTQTLPSCRGHAATAEAAVAHRLFFTDLHGSVRYRPTTNSGACGEVRNPRVLTGRAAQVRARRETAGVTIFREGKSDTRTAHEQTVTWIRFAVDTTAAFLLARRDSGAGPREWRSGKGWATA